MAGTLLLSFLLRKSLITAAMLKFKIAIFM